MTDAQTWTAIGGFLAITVALNAMLTRVMRSEFRAVAARFDAVDSRIDGEFRAVHARIEALDGRVAGLDRDVHMLVERAIED